MSRSLTGLRADRIDIQSGSRGVGAEFTLDRIQPRDSVEVSWRERDRRKRVMRYIDNECVPSVSPVLHRSFAFSLLPFLIHHCFFERLSPLFDHSDAMTRAKDANDASIPLFATELAGETIDSLRLPLVIRPLMFTPCAPQSDAVCSNVNCFLYFSTSGNSV